MQSSSNAVTLRRDAFSKTGFGRLVPRNGQLLRNKMLVESIRITFRGKRFTEQRENYTKQSTCSQIKLHFL